MNIKRQALGGFTNTPDDELLVRGTTVLQAIANNPHFPDPRPSFADATTLLNDFQDKLSIARRKGSPQDTAIKNASRETLASALQELAFYVSKVADGDLQVLLSSGFELSSYPRRTDIPGVVRGVLLREGKQSGQMRMDFTKQPLVLLYEYRYGSKRHGAEEPDWTEPFLTTSSRGHVLAPLEPYERYYVQVRGVNGLGKSPWSEPVSYIVR